MKSPRKPDYNVKALRKDNGQKGTVGGAWVNEDRTISIILNDFVTLTQDGNLLITLFLKDQPKA